MSKEKNKLKVQEYIIKKLQSSDFPIICDIPIGSPRTLNNILTPILKNILTNNFANGVDMNRFVCMFDNLFSSNVNKNKKSGLYELSTHLFNILIRKYEKLNVDSTTGFIYITDIFTNIEVVIKVNKDNSEYGHSDIIREYFIGISEINKLRYILPTFVYTFGAFLYHNEKSKKNNTPFIIFEKIPGKNMEEMLTSNSLTFTEFLGMFLQVLLGLEVAQRNVSFCHYDLHSANLICRNIDKVCKYSVPLDNNLYNISATKYLPVIIDFGLSTVVSSGTDNKIIGSYEFKKYGMLNYMLPGVDMYKFLIYCIFLGNAS